MTTKGVMKRLSLKIICYRSAGHDGEKILTSPPGLIIIEQMNDLFSELIE